MSGEFRHIVRIRGKDVAGSKSVAFGLIEVKGVGVNLSSAITRVLGIDRNMRVGNLSDEDVRRIEDALSNPNKYGVPSWYLNRQKDYESGQNIHDTGADLTLRLRSDIENMQKIKSWKGIRHMLGLKVRGQKTKTTGRTGRSVGVSRKTLPEQPKPAVQE